MELSTEKTIFEVAKVLENHIYDSVNNKTFALNQIEPELIAKKLKLKERLNSGFKSSEDIIDFLKNYLENTNHSFPTRRSSDLPTTWDIKLQFPRNCQESQN